ncbi:MAG: hypothetical protein Kow0056_06870 [Coriobacteriia bacterium]
MEFGLGIPHWAKLRGWETKGILKEAVGDILPHSILKRRDKMGYPTPLAMWLREGLMPVARELLLSSDARARRYLSPAGVEKMLDAHENGARDHHRVIWRLLTLELWLRTFFEGDITRPVTLA